MSAAARKPTHQNTRRKFRAHHPDRPWRSRNAIFARVAPREKKKRAARCARNSPVQRGATCQNRKKPPAPRRNPPAPARRKLRAFGSARRKNQKLFPTRPVFAIQHVGSCGTATFPTPHR
jgi:hypothetical protein